MWLQRLLKQNNVGTGSGGSGIADFGVGSDFATGNMPGQGNIFDQRGSSEFSAAAREKLYNARKRRKRKMLERQKWRSLKDQQ